MKGSSTEAIYMWIVILDYAKRYPPIENEVESLDGPRLKKEVLDYQQKLLLRVLAALVYLEPIFLSSLRESRDEIPFKGVSLSHPKFFQILVC